MKIQFENVNFDSRSGPNGFGLKLARSLIKRGHQVVNAAGDVRLSFIQSDNSISPSVLRLDGIYFNIDQDYQAQNSPIENSYRHATRVIVQSEFNKKLVQKYFGDRDSIDVIGNGTDFNLIKEVPAAESNVDRENIWMCASSWRPHKRLQENVRYFKTFSSKDDILLIAGGNAQKFLTEDDLKNPRIKVLGDLSWHHMISCMKASSKFLHLAYLDHCPNVVIDSRASGCQVICSSSGGTKEIAGLDDKIVVEKEWNFEPVKLYEPPAMDFSKIQIKNNEKSIDIEDVAKKYEKSLEEAIK